MRIKKTLIGYVCTLAALSGTVYAETEFHIGGFGTLGIVHSSNNTVDFTTDTTKPNGAGYTHNLDVETNTLAAVQLDAKFNEKLSATVQVMSQQNEGHNDFSPHFEWANIKYKPTSKLSIHLGRMGIPAFMASDYRLVNYANVWERAPIEVYSQVPVSHGDGIGMTYQNDVAGGVFTAQGMYFTSATESSQGDKVKVKGAKLLNASYEYGAMTFRVLVASTPVEYAPSPTQPLRNALIVLDQFLPGGKAVAEGQLANEVTGKYSAIGVTYDPGSWIAQAEYTQRKTDKSIVPTTDSWYVMAGVRVDKFTPYAMLSRLKAKGDFSDPYATALANGALAAAPVPGIGAMSIGVGMGVNAVLARKNQSQTTTSLGVRYDVAHNVALKAQYDYIKPDSGAYGMSLYPATQLTPAGSTHLVSLNLDFVF